MQTETEPPQPHISTSLKLALKRSTAGHAALDMQSSEATNAILAVNRVKAYIKAKVKSQINFTSI